MFIGPSRTWQFGLIAGLLTGLTFISVAFGVTYLFESRPFSLFAINAGYQTVLFAAMGAILGAWRQPRLSSLPGSRAIWRYTK
jgi:hypothetical protein